jgi:hypothetical protein
MDFDDGWLHGLTSRSSMTSFGRLNLTSNHDLAIAADPSLILETMSLDTSQHLEPFLAVFDASGHTALWSNFGIVRWFDAPGYGLGTLNGSKHRI